MRTNLRNDILKASKEIQIVNLQKALKLEKARSEYWEAKSKGIKLGIVADKEYIKYIIKERIFMTSFNGNKNPDTSRIYCQCCDCVKSDVCGMAKEYQRIINETMEIKKTTADNFNFIIQCAYKFDKTINNLR